ncbi:MAG: tetratricopeptide repeat protein, partial [Planctomycetes bacterium]|nr:tetratricopeptide repeat protein [Planctomycetota bacterium]
ALGVTLHECLTLDRPFHGPTRDALYRAILAGTADDVRRSNPAVSRDLAVVVSTAIAHDRARRYSDAALFAADLEAVVARRPIAARPLGALGRTLSWARREPRQATLVVALIAAALALAVTGGWLIASRDDVAAGRSAQRDRAIDDALVEGFDELGSGRHARAEAAFERALELDPANPEAAAGRIFALLRRPEHDAAVAALRDAPRSPAFERLRAMAAGVPPTPGDRGWRKAASSFELFVEGERLRAEGERHPASERPAWMRAAREHLDEAVVRSPRARAYYHHLRVFAASDAADERETRSAVDALVALWPDSPRALYAAGASLVHVDPREARELLQRATTLDPTQAPWFQSLGTAQLLLGELEEAKATFERARRLDPLDVHVLNGLGVAELNAGCLDEARAALWEAVALDPNYIEAWGNLAQIGSIEDDPEATAAAARRVIELDPGQVEYRTFCVWALLVRGDVEGGRTELEIALAQEPTNAVNWLRHGKLLLMVGEPRDAAESLARARSLDPTLAELPDLDAEASAQLAAGR